MKISKDDNIKEVIQKHPQVIEVLLDYGLHCVGCPASGLDTIEAGAKTHGFEDSDIEEIVERVNEVLEHNE